jgi:hypothetical protein
MVENIIDLDTVKSKPRGRRFNNPHVEVLYSLALWAVLVLVGFIIYFIWSQSHQPMASGGRF